MYSAGDTGTSVVPAFLTKLWTLVEDELTNDLICWDASGLSFHLLDQSRFAKEVLPFYFKHNNIASFIRQLNMYGFRKVVGIDTGGLKTERDDIEFSHPYFIRGQENLLEYIKRKVPTSSSKKDSVKGEPAEMSSLLSDVRQMRGKQENMSASLSSLKCENEALWREVATLRQKHTKQQQVVNRLIQFLLSLVGNRGVSANMKRKMPLMIDSSHNEPAKKMQKFTPNQSFSLEDALQMPSTSMKTDQDQQGLTICDITDQNNQQQLNPTQLQQAAVVPEVSSPADVKDATSSPYIYLVQSPPSSQNQTDSQGVGLTSSASSAGVPVASKSMPVATHKNQSLLTTTNANGTSPRRKNVNPQKVSVSSPASMDILGSITTLPTSMQTSPMTSLANLPINTSVVETPALHNVPPVIKAAEAPSNFKRQRSVSLVPQRPDMVDMTDHLDTMQANLDSIKDLLSGGQFAFDPSTLPDLFTDEQLNELSDIPASLGATNSTADSSNFIAGNELITYQPQDVDISNIFDLSDITHTDPNLVDFNTDLNTPLIDYTDESNPLLAGLAGIPMKKPSTEEVD